MSMQRTIIFTTILLAFSQGLAAQQQLQDTVKPQRQDTAVIHKRSFFPLPVAGYSPEKGLEVGAAMLYSFYTSKDPVLRNSTINLVPTVTTEKQFKIDLKTDIWTDANNWHFKSNLRYHDFPINFYGLGDTTRKAGATLLDNRRYKVQLEGERRIGGHFYAGMSVLYQHDTYSSKETKGVYPGMTLIDKNGGHVTFIGATGIYDNRDNQNYTTKGSWVRLNVAFAPAFLSKHALWKFDGQVRHFVPISPKSTVGFNGLFNSLQGSVLPFYLLPELGNDLIMRGYYTGRYRDQNYLAGQVEYRYFLDPKIPINIWFLHMQPKFALAAFGGSGAVFNNKDIAMSHLKPSYGMGVRWFYDEGAKLTVRIDYAWGEKRTGEERQSGLYLSLAEAF
ncbi:outer membrane protein/protective antigen OMA87-like protein [Chitinophaga pinensis DSM 2588]|uniref:Outer membrane protein/protective antigen OMA87-like protein n=2 Tax=Chitinophaga pinensis TaxID=79329 RepID=A0A979G6G1_CHIPD|nr:outer membrane protein/protective antigen OMA87-like protein [Chitinophaga pinensis DSM 2588]